jgi:protein SCO1/2
VKIDLNGILIACIVLCEVQFAHAQRFATKAPHQQPAGASPTAEMLRDVGVDQHLNARLPLEAEFRDEENRLVRLEDFFHERPVILALVYYRCPLLCTQVLNGVLKTGHGMNLEPGQDYDVVAISIDPNETSTIAAEKKRSYGQATRRSRGKQGWHFLMGDQKSISELSETVGFRYRYDPGTGQFAHSSAVMVVTPDGRLSRYFFGIEYPPTDMRLALVESSSGKIGSLADYVLLLCYHYDPLTGKYGLAISRALTISGVATVIALSAFLVVMFREEMRRPKLFRQREAPL